MIDAAAFEAQRDFLFGLAYRITGLAAESEDLVQDAWLRASRDPGAVDHPRAYLATIVTRLAIDRMKAARTTREQYVGPWLPEPVLTSPAGSPDDTMARAESVTMGFLVLLETLSPTERAVLLLRDVFDYEYDEIAATLDLTPANCRQLLHRARMRIGARRPRYRPDPERQRKLVEQFLASAATGDLGGLTNMLRADVTFTGDGGGKVAAAKRPIAGLEAVARLIVGIVRAGRAIATTEFVEVNGETAFLAWKDGALDSVWVFSMDDGRITAIRAIRNPEKLRYIMRQVAASGL